MPLKKKIIFTERDLKNIYNQEVKIIFLNNDEFRLIDNWIANEDSIWRHLILPKALKEGLMHYLQQRNNGQFEQTWIRNWDTFLEKLGIDIDDELFTSGVEEDSLSEQNSKAREIVNIYCEHAKTIESIQKLMDSTKLEEYD